MTNEVRKALVRICELQQAWPDKFQEHGYVFERFPRNLLTDPPRTDGERWEALAFSLYADLCHAETIARAALEQDDE